jgi:hypothetical protein
LRLHDAPAEQPSATDQILPKELGNDELDVGHIDLVDQTVDGFLQSFPCHTLVFFAVLIRYLRLQRAQSSWWYVCAPRSHIQQFFILSFGGSLLLLLGHGLPRSFLLLMLTQAFGQLALSFDRTLGIDTWRIAIFLQRVTRWRATATRGRGPRWRRAFSRG